MNLLQRNLKPFHYCLFAGMVAGTDEYGNATSPRPTYGEPVEMLGNISAAQGQAQVEVFGNADLYSKSITVADTTSPIDENTVLFVDKEPEFAEDGTPLFDYVVKRVAKSLNYTSYAIDKVEVS